MSDEREIVSIVRVGEDVTGAVAEAIDLAGGLPDLTGKTAVIKPNLMSPTPSGEATVTDSRVTGAVTELALHAGAEVIIAEGSAVGFVGPTDQWDTMEAFEVSGTADVARALGVPIVDLNRESYVATGVTNAYALATVPVPSTIAKADMVISVPVFKSHPFTGMTVACKNLQGVMPWRLKRATHRAGLEAGLSDISAAVSRGFAVVDGTMAQALGGPISLGLIIAGRNCTAVDATCARMVGYEPDRLALLRFNAERGLGVIDESKIEVVGESLQNCATRWPWASMIFVNHGPEIEWVLRDPMPCTACMHGAGVGFAYVRSVHGPESLRGLRVAVGGDPDLGGPENVDLVVGDCAATWASGAGHVPGRAPSPAVVAAEACRILGLDIDPIIAYRRQVPGSDWEDIEAASNQLECPAISF